MTELALSDERKPLIFPPFHHQSGGEEVAVGAQTADDVICNCGPLVSRENCSHSQHVAKWLPARLPAPPSHKINSGGSIDKLQKPGEYFFCHSNLGATVQWTFTAAIVIPLAFTNSFSLLLWQNIKLYKVKWSVGIFQVWKYWCIHTHRLTRKQSEWMCIVRLKWMFMVIPDHKH